MLEFKFTGSRGFQSFMAKLYGWGAMLVIAGALFKLQHWAGASEMLIIGMGTECVIFFFSAFEPLEKKYHWENVFPELVEASGEATINTLGGVATGSGVASNTPAPQLNVAIDKQQTDKLKSGIERLGDTIDQLGGLAAVAEASARLTENLDKANESVGSVSSSANNLSSSYNNTASTVGLINEQAKKDIEAMAIGQAAYSQQVSKLEKSLAATNASFELQLQEHDAYKKSYQALNNEIGALVASAKKSVDQTQVLTASMEALNTNVAQLNSVYGSMLNAVTSVLNK